MLVNSARAILIRVLLIREGDQWLAQALDYDLATQAPSEPQAVESFFRILRARLRKDTQSGRAPLQGLPQAPHRFLDIWNRLEKTGHPR